jgi:hypothetical protein
VFSEGSSDVVVMLRKVRMEAPPTMLRLSQTLFLPTLLLRFPMPARSVAMALWRGRRFAMTVRKTLMLGRLRGTAMPHARGRRHIAGMAKSIVPTGKLVTMAPATMMLGNR